MTPTDSIRRCIDHCASRRDERGRWRAAIKCAAELRAQGTSPAIAEACAQAARRLGAWLETAARRQIS